jgi:hypothetical protein
MPLAQILKENIRVRQLMIVEYWAVALEWEEKVKTAPWNLEASRGPGLQGAH